MPGNAKVNFVFKLGVQSLDSTKKIPALIVGNIKLLKLLQFNDVKSKLESLVTPEVFKAAVENLQPNPSDVCSLYLKQFAVAGFSDIATHYNSTAQPHLLTKIIKSVVTGPSWTIIVVCEKKNIFASGCAAVRAFSLYSRKTHPHSEKPTDSNYQVEFLAFQDGKLVAPSEYSKPELRDVVKSLDEAAYGIQLTARIVDTPCCDMDTNIFLKEIEDVAKKLKITPFVIAGEELKKQGFGGLYAVGRAAACEPMFVVLSHAVPNATDTIAWVGKGIVYDTGGLCIKGRTSMPGMKGDCGGAAAILGAFYAAVKRGFKQNLHAIFCLAENAVGPLSTKPDDVCQLFSGRTVEINNTDAEGRLVLADGVAFAQTNLKANIILDMATLTGAQSISTGKYHAAVMSNNQTWEQLVVRAGLECGDLAFPIPYCPELHFSEFTSAVADMKNSCADRTNALSSCAGLFIASHLGFDTKTTWIHVDIAGPAHSGERATGYGVALLVTLFGNWSNDEHLQSLCPNRNKIVGSSGEPASPSAKRMKTK